MFISSDLSWDIQVREITRKVNGALSRLRYRGDILSLEVRKILVQSLVFPLIDYFCVLQTNITKDQNTKLDRLLNRCIRFIFRLRRDTSITPYRRQLGWLTASKRRDYFIALTFYRYQSSMQPPYYSEFLPKIDESIRRSIRLNPLKSLEIVYDLPRTNSDSLSDSFFYSAYTLWQTLPVRLRTITYIETFRIHLFNYLFANDI